MRPSDEGLPVADQGLDLDAPPAEASQKREVRPAVERQRPKAPAPPPPREVASFPVQLAVVGCGELADGALDHRRELDARDAVVHTPTLSLGVEVRPRT